MQQLLLSVLLIFAPGMIGAFVHRYMTNQTMPAKAFLALSFIYAFFITICVGIAAYLRGHGTVAYMSMFYSVATVVKCGLLSTVFAVILPMIGTLLLSILKKAAQRFHHEEK